MTHTQSWHDQRRQGIGGSDAGAVCGVSKYKTPYQVWEEKRGLTPPIPDNPAMAYGRMMEPVIRQWYADQTGREVRVPETILQHPKYPFMLANLDGCTEDRRIVEVKTGRNLAEWGEPGTDQIPLLYIFQVQHYMLVTGFEVADVVASLGGQMPVIYEIPADKELQEMLIDQEASFWQLVETDTPPEAVSYQDMVRRFSKSVAKEIQADTPTAALVLELSNLTRIVKGHEESIEDVKAKIMGFMGENDTLTGPDGKPLITWKSSKPRETFDSKSFLAAHPETYKEYLKVGEASRRFLLK